MLTPGDGVIVGLSGGADSVALLSVLLALSCEMKLNIYVAHVNHNLRGVDSITDEQFVRAVCEKWGVPLYIYQADVKGLAVSSKLSIEEAGRKLRYEYFRHLLAKCCADKIAVGHNEDDNAETVLLNLFRGAGLRGLCGIPPVNGHIIRPLLEVSRKKIEEYIRLKDLDFVTDETNVSHEYTRNCIRSKIMPEIRKYFGENVSTIMARNAHQLRVDEGFLSDTTREAMAFLYVLQDANSSSGENDFLGKDAFQNKYSSLDKTTYVTCSSNAQIVISIHRLLTLPEAIARRIIRGAIFKLRGEQALHDIQATHIYAILDIARGQSGRVANLPGFSVRREYENLVLYASLGNTEGSRGNVNPAYGFAYLLPLDMPTYILEINKTIKLTLQPQKHYTRAFNYDIVEGVLELRTRRPGDKITLVGVGTKKLQDYFTDTKTPRHVRDNVPLLADGSNILWIMDKHNRVNTLYNPVEDARTCWVTCAIEGDTYVQK